MELIKALAIALHEENDGKWPEGATEVQQTGSETVEFDAEVFSYTSSYDGRVRTFGDMEVSGLDYLGEWDTGDTVTKEEYEAFMAANPTFYKDMMDRRPFLVQEIARLNKQVGALIDEMTKLADEAGVELNIDLGQHGSLDPASDWNASRC